MFGLTFLHDSDGFPRMIVFMLGRFFAMFAYIVGFQFTVEVMPTCLRGRGVALANVMAMVAMVAAPAIVYSVSFSLMKKQTFNNLFSECLEQGSPLSADGYCCIARQCPWRLPS